MQVASKNTAVRNDKCGGSGVEVCPDLVCACRPDHADKDKRYQPSRYQLREHCVQDRHVRCPLRGSMCVPKKKY
jgi:hypothetical protein